MRDEAIHPSAFSEYALSSDLTEDETYTVELLIEGVRSDFDPAYWHEWDDRDKRLDARKAPGYQPHFSPEHVAPTAKKLLETSWLSLQRINRGQRPVRNLKTLRGLPKITTLVLTNNDIADLTPLAFCPQLHELILNANPVQDLTPLTHCQNLESLEIADIPAEDFSPLQDLPKLRELEISSDQLPAFTRLKCLPALRKLTLRLGNLDSDSLCDFRRFPDMPELRVIWGADAGSLEGLQQFPKLENLVNLDGPFDSLEPLQALHTLTHINILDSHVASLKPLRKLPALREVFLSTSRADLDLSPLESLPALHDAVIKCAKNPHPALDRLRAELTPWDVEFRSEKPRHTPSLEIEAVDQETFDFYDGKKPYNLKDGENEGMLRSELEWLDEKLEEVFPPDFTEAEDYTLPFHWAGARSRTVVLSSEGTIEAFPRLALGMQQVLAHAKNDWILHLQSDEAEPEFIVWLYPQKIVTTPQYADAVRELIKPR